MSSLSVSVVIPIYNAERYLASTIESVLAQTFNNYEIICVNDGSTDGSMSVVKQFEGKARVLEQPNSGQTVAQNLGVAASTGRYIAFLDADDLWYPHKLEEQVAVMEDFSDVVMVSCNHDEIDAEGRVRRQGVGRVGNPLTGLLGEDFFIAVPSFMLVRRTALDRAGGLDPLLTVYDSDTDLCVRLRDVGGEQFVERPGGARRVHPASNTYSHEFARRRHQCCVHLMEKIRSRYAAEPDKEPLARSILASRYSDWGWYEARTGNRTEGLRLLRHALSLDPGKFRTISRVARAYFS